MAEQAFQTGDWVIYRKTKHSRHPGPRATNVVAASHGDEYSYTVDKFWIVANVNSDGTLLLRTRSGKQHTISSTDPSVRKANLWERWRYKDRFESASTGDDQAQVSDHASQTAT